MGANIHYYFLEGTDIEFIQMFLSRTLGSPLKEDENGNVQCVDKYATFVLESVDKRQEKLQEKINEVKDGSKIRERSLKRKEIMDGSINSFNRNKEKIEAIIGKKKWDEASINFDYHNLYLYFDKSCLGQGSIYYHNHNNDEIKPKENIAGYMSLGMNLKWAFLSDKMVDFFGGKVIFYDGKDFDDPTNFKLVEKEDAICKLELGDLKGNLQKLAKALKEIKEFDENDIITFADKAGYKVNSNDELMLMLPYQSKLTKEEMQKDLEVTNKSVKKILKF